MQRKSSLGLLIVLALLFSTVSAHAQDGNLLGDPGMEGPYSGRAIEGADVPTSSINVPTAWNLWVAFSPRTEGWMNRTPSIFPHGSNPEVHGGSKSLNFTRDGGTFTIALYQQATVTSGQNLSGSAWAWVHTCKPEPEVCQSNSSSGARARVGIDPNGGTDPGDSDIVWSNWISPHDQWQQASATATTTATTATIFLYVTQDFPATGSGLVLNRAYWDDAFLGVGGAGGTAPSAATAAPTAPPEVAFVVPQPPQDDGSLVHVVGAGDTIDSIAVAYRTTRLEIMQLNNISDPRIISLGQRLLIRAAPSGSSASDAGSEGESETEGESEGEGSPPDAETEGESTRDPNATEEAEQPAERPTAIPATAPVVSVSSGNVLPAIDPASATGAVCVSLFHDDNQNRIQEIDETLLEGGVIVINTSGAEVATYETDGESEPYCFTDLTPGDYVAAATAPDGFGLTTPDDLRLRVVRGTALEIMFGAAEGVTAPTPLPPDTSAPVIPDASAQQAPAEDTSFVAQVMNNIGLIIFGLAGVVLIAGAGAAVYLRRR